MDVLRRAAELSAALDEARAAGRSVGLVPTMGALHAGHRSLVERAASECDVVAVTIFVNPLQFDDPADLDAYPRDLGADVALLSEAGAGIVFVPDVTEIYPGYPEAAAVTVHVSGLTEVLEGEFRPGHFDGVATVVAKLFAMAGTCRAYFGEKDFQQVAVVRKLARDLCFPVEVVACPIVREADGLALSSRNVRLAAERPAAAVLYEALGAGVDAVSRGETDPSAVRAVMLDVLAGEPGVSVDYAVAVEPETLVAPSVIDADVRLLVAARVGAVRLIDNVAAQRETYRQPIVGTLRRGIGEREPQKMRRRMMKSKIHRATVTDADLNYVGSISLDPELMRLADIDEYEQVAVLDIDNGARFETYAIVGGPGEVCLNGAAARLVQRGDKVIVLTYADYDEAELESFSPLVVHVDASNRVIDEAAARLDVELSGAPARRQPAPV